MKFTPSVLLAAASLILAGSAAFFPFKSPVLPPAAPVAGDCVPSLRAFNGYTFLLPGIVDARSAYAPFLTEWGDFYRDSFLTIDWQKKENVEEWAKRFCDLPDPLDVEAVVYRTVPRDLQYLRELTVRKKGVTDLPYPFADNSFAQCIVFNGCTEVVDYLLFAKKCEDFTIPKSSKWRLQPDNAAGMQTLIREGKQRFGATESHFLRMRYAYQVVRLAHYSGQWNATIDLFNELLPKVDRRTTTTSAIYFWTLGHVAGALQQLGRNPEAAYRYALIFRHSAGKRAPAFESFSLRTDDDWRAALHLCQNDHERATLYLLRATRYRSTATDDLTEVFALDPENPQLPLALVSEVQQLEKVFLRTPVTDKKYGPLRAALRQELASKHLFAMQELVRNGVKSGQVSNLPLWRCLDGYLELLAGDHYAAEQTFRAVERQLPDSEYGSTLVRQIEIWRTLSEIQQLDTARAFNYAKAYSIRSYDAFKDHWDFEPYMRDLLAEHYLEARHPGKAVLTAYGPRALLYNPDLATLEDLLREANAGSADFLQMTEAYDTSQGRIELVARLLEAKGMALFNAGQPEAALLTMQKIESGERLRLDKFYPFRDTMTEHINLTLVDSLHLTRLEFLEKILDFELQARGAEALEAPVAAWYYYLIGLGHYNTSYFGYAWGVRDYYRQGKNWTRLPQGPVFPLTNSPAGNRENLDLSRALAAFQKSLSLARNPEMAARAAFMAARCQQKMWFCDPECTYRPGSKLIPRPPERYFGYYNALLTQYGNTEFARRMVRECKWLGAYAR